MAYTDPDAVVIALTPTRLTAIGDFACEVCDKKFRSDQNLQLHMRKHKLSWRLRKHEDRRKKAYVCPINGCVYNDTSRALSDLTAIKRHYGRKHGAKKWHCRCGRSYAVQCDWKAHMKICRTLPAGNADLSVQPTGNAAPSDPDFNPADFELIMQDDSFIAPPPPPPPSMWSPSHTFLPDFPASI